MKRFISLFMAGIFSILLISQNSPIVFDVEAASKTKAIVIIPGIGGTELQDLNNNLLWIDYNPQHCLGL